MSIFRNDESILRNCNSMRTWRCAQSKGAFILWENGRVKKIEQFFITAKSLLHQVHMDAKEIAWLVCTKDIRFFTGTSIFGCPLRFSPRVRWFFGVKRKHVSNGRIHKKTPSSFPLVGVFYVHHSQLPPRTY
jgi:hypothetical protein